MHGRLLELTRRARVEEKKKCNPSALYTLHPYKYTQLTPSLSLSTLLFPFILVSIYMLNFFFFFFWGLSWSQNISLSLSPLLFILACVCMYVLFCEVLQARVGSARWIESRGWMGFSFHPSKSTVNPVLIYWFFSFSPSFCLCSLHFILHFFAIHNAIERGLWHLLRRHQIYITTLLYMYVCRLWICIYVCKAMDICRCNI